MLSQVELHQRFEYRNGELFYKISSSPKIKAGNKVGTLNNGYIKVSIGRKKYLAHRIIWMMQYGFLPAEIDHINNNRSDNRIENLRQVNRTQNRCNISSYKNNTSGTKGVSWQSNLSKWQVSISVDGKRKYLGVFKDLELAELVSMEARNKFHGRYANHGVEKCPL
jgi:hypothetical protein